MKVRSINAGGLDGEGGIHGAGGDMGWFPSLHLASGVPQRPSSSGSQGGGPWGTPAWLLSSPVEDPSSHSAMLGCVSAEALRLRW